MATIKFLVRGKSEQTNIYIRLSIDRNNVYKRKTGFIINPKDWSFTKGQPIQKDENLKILKNNLDKLSKKIEENYNEGIKKGVIFSGNWLQGQIDFFNNKIPVTNHDLLTNYIDFIVNTAHTRKNNKGGIGLSISRIKSYKVFKEMILRYEKILDKKILIRDIDIKFIDNFKMWLFDENYNVNYIGKNIDNLKAICIDAQKNSIETSNQVNKIQSISENKETDEILYLSFDELEKIENAEIKKSYLINARKWLLLGCYIGQRGTDLLNATSDKIKEVDKIKILEIEQEKTKKRVAIPLLPKAIEILETGFPHTISIQKFTDYIKDICEIAEINTLTKGMIMNSETKRKIKGIYPKYKLLGSHVCRRSFASNFYGDIPTTVLMGITGHSTEKMFLKYIGKTSYDSAKQMIEYFSKLKPREKKTQLKILKIAN